MKSRCSAFDILRPSLFYLLYNYRLYEPDRLVWALYYQTFRSWDKCPSYIQILQAFDDKLARHLLYFRQLFGELDEEPLVHLVLEQGLVDYPELQQALSLWKSKPETYFGKILIEQGLLSEDQLELLLLYPHFSAPEEQAESFRNRALRMMEQRLWMRGYLSHEDAESLRLVETASPWLKPFSDVMVMNGDLPRHLQNLIWPATSLEQDPLWKVLESAGLDTEPMIVRLQRQIRPEELSQNLCIRLVKRGLLPRHRLSNLVLHVMRAQLPEIRIQGTGASQAIADKHLSEGLRFKA